MSKNKNNKPIWGTRIKKNASTLFKKVGGSLPIDKRLFKEDIEGSIAHVEMLHKQKIIKKTDYLNLLVTMLDMFILLGLEMIR